jgi:GR25 family glycosyltransferase involved in LPS biosynthesis
MDKLDKIFYINLDRRPDRKAHFIQSCIEDAQIPLNIIERFDALDGKTYKPSETESKMFSNCDFLGQPYFNNILGNQLGHYYILKNIIKNKYNCAIICQDDVYFRKDFQEYFGELMKNIPEDAEIINIGLHLHAVYSHFVPWNISSTSDEEYFKIGETRINEYVCKLKNNINPCSLAYIVTLQGAINLVDYFEKTGFRRATDWNLNDYLVSKNIFYCSLPVLCTGNPNLTSDIFV